MKYLTKIFYVVTLFGISLFLSCTTLAVERGEVNWYSYQEGIEKIADGEKMGFLYFYTDWCGFCQKIDEETFSEKTVSDYLNENFVPIKVNAEGEREVAAQYGVRQYPQNLFLSTEVEVIAGRPGFVPADQMIDILKYMHTESFKTMTFSDFVRNQ